MKKQPQIISDVPVAGKSVLVRGDLEFSEKDSPRGRTIDELVGYLKDHGAWRIKVIGHKGREEMTMWWPEVAVEWDIRKDPREQADDAGLAREWAEGWEIYVDEAFGTAHRKHASVDALPRYMKERGDAVAMGIRFAKETSQLSEVLVRTGKKVLVIGGAKAEDKAGYARELAGKFDQVLVGGLLPEQILSSHSEVTKNVILAKLRDDGLDIDDESIQLFKEETADAAVVVVAGPMGKFEEVSAQKGTREVLGAVVSSQAYRVAGGGNTEEALQLFGLTAEFDWVSVGGGAMCEFLVAGTLPGIEALVE